LRGVQIVAPRSIIAWAKSPRLGVGRDRAGEPVDLLPRRRQRGLDREQPGDDPLDIGVDHHRPPPEGDRGDGGGGVAADPGQRRKSSSRSGKRRQIAGDGARAGDQVAGAGIIAEPGPGGHHLLVGRGGERLDVGQRRVKASK
jgi:hypothetical protein